MKRAVVAWREDVSGVECGSVAVVVPIGQCGYQGMNPVRHPARYAGFMSISERNMHCSHMLTVLLKIPWRSSAAQSAKTPHLEGTNDNRLPCVRTLRDSPCRELVTDSQKLY